MRHNRQTHRLGRSDAERRAMLETLVTSLLKHQRIQTTLPKAKAAQRLADHVITLGKRDTLAARRQVFSYLQNHQLTSRLFKEVAPRFKDRQGGYTRILRLERRKGDGATLALLELTEREIKAKEAVKKKPKKERPEPTAPKPHEPKRAEQQKVLPQVPPPVDKEKPKLGFFKNISRFFRNKGGG